MGEKIITGNYFDKYNTQNFIYKKLMSNFFSIFLHLINSTEEKNIKFLEVGCGEGELAKILHDQLNNIYYHGFDIDKNIINQAKENNPKGKFTVASAYDMSFIYNQEYDIVIASEVLEHLDNPHKAMIEIQKLKAKYFLFSVPREPIWRILNMARFKYLLSLGNTPGHLKNWSKRGFKKFVSEYFNIIETKSPLPWTVVLCQNK